jgi:anthranilate phosphoribosyltransferase
MHRRVRPGGRGAEADTLPQRVDACVRPTGCVSNGAAGKEPLQDSLEFGLNRPAGGLALPTDKSGAVVLECGEEGPAHLRQNLAVSDTSGKLRKCLSRLTKAALSGYNFFPPTRTQSSSTSVPVANDAALRFAIQQIAHGASLDREGSAAAFGVIMRGEASPVQIAALLIGLRSKGETCEEVAGAGLALRSAMTRLETPRPELLVDTCGTGGGKVGTLNISTAAAFVVAGAGVPVAKHGNRSYTSRSGSADVLEALDVCIELDPGAARQALVAAGITFLFAPIYHPAMRHMGPVRKELAVPTIMNLVGPLANPAGVTRQVIGVSDAGRAKLIADTLAVLGGRHALVLHAKVGMDEISPSGSTLVWEVQDGSVNQWELEPSNYGLACADLAGLAGGEPAENARRITQMFAGDDSKVARCAVLLNAAAALYVSGNKWSFGEAVERATTALDQGAAAQVLARLQEVAPRRQSPQRV